MSNKKRPRLSNQLEELREHIEKLTKDSKYDESAWNDITEDASLYVWRIEIFNPVILPTIKYGEFFDEDSYIILKRSKNSEMHDIYIWIGLHSTIDEYATAAIKMVELDYYIFNGKAVQHREFQGEESESFLSLFKKFIIYKGGVKSGLKEVVDEILPPRLLHISKIKNFICVQEISFRLANLTEDDVFVIDMPQRVIQVNGINCSKDEKFEAAMTISQLKSSKSKSTFEIIDDYEVTKKFPELEKIPWKEGKSTMFKSRCQISCCDSHEISLWKVSDHCRKPEFEKISTGTCNKSTLDSRYIFILHTCDSIYTWIGKSVSKIGRFESFVMTQEFANGINTPKFSIIVVQEGQETLKFWSYFE